MDEELSSRQLPQSLEAEQAVLGSILIDSRCLTDVIGVLRPEDFYLKQNVGGVFIPYLEGIQKDLELRD